MARILYGVHGTGHGHAMRALTIARAMPQHEFLFATSDDAPAVLEGEFAVTRLPNLGTVFKNYKVDLAATIGRAVPLLWHRKKYVRQAVGLIEKFRPDICMTDLEYFVPRAAEIAGVPCLTLDHQHVITSCRHDLPGDMLKDAFIQGLTPRFLFRPTMANIIISFYSPPLLSPDNTCLAPPILRESVLRLKPQDEGYILVYQSNSTDSALLDFLKTSIRKVYIFGYGKRTGTDGNLIFRPKSEEEFLRLLAGCAYVIQGGSHTLMSEALYLGKPVLSIPIAAMVEQRFNAWYLDKLGYGRQAPMSSLNADFLAKFEEVLPCFKKNISGANFLGNKQVFDMIEFFIKNAKLPQ